MLFDGAIMASRKSYCIICGQEKDGIEIENDYVISTIRWFKRNITKNEKDNKIVVCKECYPKYKVLRKRFENRQKIYITLGILFIIFGMIISPRVGTLIVTVIVAIFLYLLSLLSYTPKIKLDVQAAPLQPHVAEASNKRSNKRLKQ
jgi:hypothetical protein